MGSLDATAGLRTFAGESTGTLRVQFPARSAGGSSPMKYGLKRTIPYVRGTDVAGRSQTVYPDDTFIVSYPRSGNTWTRFLVGNLVRPDERATFANIERLVPGAEAQSSRYLKRVPRPRVIKCHQYFDHRYP